MCVCVCVACVWCGTCVWCVCICVCGMCVSTYVVYTCVCACILCACVNQHVCIDIHALSLETPVLIKYSIILIIINDDS